MPIIDDVSHLTAKRIASLQREILVGGDAQYVAIVQCLVLEAIRLCNDPTVKTVEQCVAVPHRAEEYRR